MPALRICLSVCSSTDCSANSASSPASMRAIVSRNSSSESVAPWRAAYIGSGSIASSARRTSGYPPIWPLCMNSQWPKRNGWQFCRAIAVPVEARTWAKNSRERTVAHSDCRFWSDQAGITSR